MGETGFGGEPRGAPGARTSLRKLERLVDGRTTGTRTSTTSIPSGAGLAWANIQSGSKVAIAVVDRETLKGYRFVGTPEAITSGEVFDQTQAAMRQRGMMAPLKAVVKVRVDKIFNLGMPGAGEQVG